MGNPLPYDLTGLTYIELSPVFRSLRLDTLQTLAWHTLHWTLYENRNFLEHDVFDSFPQEAFDRSTLRLLNCCTLYNLLFSSWLLIHTFSLPHTHLIFDTSLCVAWYGEGLLFYFNAAHAPSATT
jgi:hypothetical protein